MILKILIYKSNPNLKKSENVKEVKYTPDGFLKYYSDPKDLEKMKFDPKKESFDNCIIIFYEEENSSNSFANTNLFIPICSNRILRC